MPKEEGNVRTTICGERTAACLPPVALVLHLATAKTTAMWWCSGAGQQRPTNNHLQAAKLHNHPKRNQRPQGVQIVVHWEKMLIYFDTFCI